MSLEYLAVGVKGFENECLSVDKVYIYIQVVCDFGRFFIIH